MVNKLAEWILGFGMKTLLCGPWGQQDYIGVFNLFTLHTLYKTNLVMDVFLVRLHHLLSCPLHSL
jgi:hypothetical protein